MRTSRSTPLIVFTSCLVFCSSVYAAETSKTERQVSVQGHGKVPASPDMARIWVQVSEEGSRVDTVTQQVRSKMDAVLKVIKAQGVAEKDIQTQVYQVSPKMEWKNGRSNRVGYTASNRVEVKVHDLKKTGTILAAVVDAGANDVTGPQFGFENPQELERKALGLALNDAKAKAALLAQAAGATLGDVMRIDESASYRPVPRPMMAMKAMTVQASEESVQAGEENVEATVNAAFALK